MLFNSETYLYFFPVVVLVYYATPFRYRWGWLLAASYYFYASWKLEYLVLILISTLVDYVTGIKMAGLPERRKRRPYLILSLVANLGLLFGFKYFNFFSHSLQSAFQAFDFSYAVPVFDVLLPVGISFYTFQTLSYSIDVYRGRKTPERHLGRFALYVSFFPQLVAGPIERADRLLPQLEQHHHFSYDNLTSGLARMLWGFFKKMVIADNLAPIVDKVYANPEWFFGWSDFAGHLFVCPPNLLRLLWVPPILPLVRLG